MGRGTRIIIWTAALAGWLAASVLGFAQLWRYEGLAGPAASPPQRWPAQTRVMRDSGVATLVLLMHPKCPCSRASVDELSRIMARSQGQLAAKVLMVKPTGAPEGWEQTEMWRAAAAIPGVSVIIDEQGVEARRFAGGTSGQALLYAADGQLLFRGGITASRGHSGDNAGRSIILGLLHEEIERSKAIRARTPVYGCPLFDKCEEGTNVCRK